jgi:integrase
MELKLRGKTYYVHFDGPNGERYRLSTGSADLTTAQLKATEIMRRHLIGDAPLNDGRAVPIGLLTLGDMLSHAWQVKWRETATTSMKARVQRLQRDLGHLTWDQLSTARIREYLDGATNNSRKHSVEPLSKATKNRYVSCICTAMKLAQEKNRNLILPQFPSWSEKDNIKDVFMDPAEEKAFLEFFLAAKKVSPKSRSQYEYMEALFVVLTDTGMRAGEALEQTSKASLFPSYEDPKFIVLRHGTTKNKKGRAIPLTARAKEAFKVMVEHPTHGTINSTVAGGRWANITERLGLSHITLHILRHTYASRLVMQGVSIAKVAQLLGHSSTIVTQRYAHLRPEGLLEVVGLLESYSDTFGAPAADAPAAPEAGARAGLRLVSSR